MDNQGGGSRVNDLSVEELMEEYSSHPPEIAEWLWCIEYVAKFVKDIRCIFDLMNMGYEYSNDYGKRINEVLSLRILEFMFDPSKNETSDIASTSEARVDFDFSLSNSDVLREILKEIPLSDLRAGMSELYKFNVLPFIAHKNMCIPQCALEKLRDLSLMENRTVAAPSTEANDPVSRDDRSVPMDTCEEKIDEQQVPVGLDKNTNEKDKAFVTVGDDEGKDREEPMHTKEKDEVVVVNEETDNVQDEPIHTNEKEEEVEIDEDTVNDQDAASDPITEDGHVKCTKDGTWLINGTDEPITEGKSVKCTKDGTWLISGSDDDDNESDMVNGQALEQRDTNNYTNLLPPSSRTRPENVCWKCGKEGALLICSRSECGSKVHEECLNSVVNVDEDGKSYCPVCWYDRVVKEYFEAQKLMISLKRRLEKFKPFVSTRSKRLRG